MRAVATAGNAASAAWRRWPLALSGLCIMVLGPSICWSLVIGGELPRLGLLAAEHHHWVALVGSLAVWLGWALLGAHIRPRGSRLGGAFLGAMLYVIAGWTFFLGLAMYYGHKPLDIVTHSPSLFDFRLYVAWPIVAAAVLGLIRLD